MQNLGTKKRSWYQKGDLGQLDTSKKTSRYQKKTHPVILKPVGRIFEISDSNPIQRKCGKCGRLSHPRTLIFFSLLFWISLLFSFPRNSLLFCAFFPSFPRILGVRQRQKILAFMMVFLAVFQKSKEKKIRGKQGSEETPQNENAENAENADTKRGKCGKCGWLALMWLALGDPQCAFSLAIARAIWPERPRPTNKRV